MAVEIICKNYEHFNRSLGKQIRSKAQYQREMERQGFVSQEKGEQIAERARSANHKDYNGLSGKAEEVVKAAYQMKDSKGNIKCSDRLVDAMKEVGVKLQTRFAPGEE